MLLGIKRTPSEFQINLGKHWQAPHVELDLFSSHKRIKLDDECFLKDSAQNLNLEKSNKPTNNAMIKAIDSDDAMDYLRVRKQAGESKINIKKAIVFDKVPLFGKEEVEENKPLQDLEMNVQ